MVMSRCTDTCFLHGSLVFGECRLLVQGLGVRRATQTRCKSLNYTAAGTDVKIHVVYLLHVTQTINFWPSFYIVISHLRFSAFQFQWKPVYHTTLKEVVFEDSTISRGKERLLSVSPVPYIFFFSQQVEQQTTQQY